MCRMLKRSVKSTIVLDSIFLTYKIIKSILFNILMLALGFVLGFGYVVSIEHANIMKSNGGKSIETIKECLDQHIEINKKMEKEFDKLFLFIERNGK